MAAGLSFNESNLTRVRGAFKSYCEYNRRDRDFLWKDQTRKLATDLYVETAAIAPTRAEIAAEVKQLGWAIPTRFADGRLGRGTPKQWIGWAYTKMKRRVRRRGRKSKADHLDDAEFMAQKPTLQQMQQFVIDMRDKARLFLASGWLGAILELGGSPKATSGFVQHDRGGAFITRVEGRVAVTFWNRTPGIATMQEKKDFVGKAFQKRIADMWIYIRRKRGENRAQLRTAA